MTLILILGAVVIGLGVVIVLLIPSTTSTTVEIHFDTPIDKVWEVYTDFECQTNWRHDVASVEMDPNQKSWTETLSHPSPMAIRFLVLEKTAPKRLVLQTSADGIFEGKYIAEFKSTQSGTTATFTEETTSLGFIPKIMSRLFVNQQKLIETYADEAKAEINRRNSTPIKTHQCDDSNQMKV